MKKHYVTKVEKYEDYVKGGNIESITGAICTTFATAGLVFISKADISTISTLLYTFLFSGFWTSGIIQIVDGFTTRNLYNQKLDEEKESLTKTRNR